MALLVLPGDRHVRAPDRCEPPDRPAARLGRSALPVGATRRDHDRMTEAILGNVPPVATLVTSAASDALAWHPLQPFSGVDYKLLWRSGKSVAGVMRLMPGGEVSLHSHVRSHHHMWVIDGDAEMLGERVGPGTYVHVPAGVEHGIREVGDDACTVLYLYLRDELEGSGPGGAVVAADEGE
jgi:mannose-6-phosphate isomerase-like protein (cupin superfamily)